MPGRSKHSLDVRVWDVEHGSAMYIRAGRRNVVIDCGEGTDFSPLKWIRSPRFGVTNLDYLIISHPHHDHIADLDNIAECGLKPDIIRRPKSATTLVEENLEDARKQDKQKYIDDAEYYLNVLDEYDGDVDVPPSNPNWAMDTTTDGGRVTDGGIPDRGITFHNYGTNDSELGNDNYEKLNNLSILTVINVFGFKLVTGGDILPAGLSELKNRDYVMEAVKDSDVLVAPHHGRDSSFDEEFVKHIDPEIVVSSDKSRVDNDATTEYGRLANGAPVEHEATGNTTTRSVVTTRNDGRVRIQASNRDLWEISVYGRDYAQNKANSRRYPED